MNFVELFEANSMLPFDELLNIGIQSDIERIRRLHDGFHSAYDDLRHADAPDEEGLMTALATLPERALTKLTSLTIVTSSGATCATV